MAVVPNRGAAAPRVSFTILRGAASKYLFRYIKLLGVWVVLAIFAKKQQFSVALPTP